MLLLERLKGFEIFVVVVEVGSFMVVVECLYFINLVVGKVVVWLEECLKWLLL